jgi:hypothetical protein
MKRVIGIVVVLFALAPTLAAGMEKDITPHYCAPYACGPVRSSLQQPSLDEIREWWFPMRTWEECKDLSIERIERVVLESHEEAFLCEVWFPDRPRLFLSGALLVRPNLKEAREIAEMWRDFEVYDFDGDGVSEIVTWGYGLAQGHTDGWKSILHFDGWEPVILHKQNFGDSLGCCGKEIIGRECDSKEVYWSFTDLDGDGKIDLMELLIYKEGPEPEQLKWKTETHAYLFKGGKLVPATPNLKSHGAK